MMIWHACIWFHGRRLPWFSESRSISQIPARMGLYIESRLGVCHILRHITTSGFDDRSWIDWLSDISHSVYLIYTWLHTAIHTCTLHHTRGEEASQRIYWNWKGRIANTPILGGFAPSTFIDIILEISASRYVHLLTLIYRFGFHPFHLLLFTPHPI